MGLSGKVVLQAGSTAQARAGMWAKVCSRRETARWPVCLHKCEKKRDKRGYGGHLEIDPDCCRR